MSERKHESTCDCTDDDFDRREFLRGSGTPINPVVVKASMDEDSG